MRKMKSLNEHRLKQNPLEKHMSDKWNSYNGNNSGSPTILYRLLAEDSNYPKGEVSERDEIVATTLVQWLGSPVGVSFLKECGFENKTGIVEDC